MQSHAVQAQEVPALHKIFANKFGLMRDAEGIFILYFSPFIVKSWHFDASAKHISSKIIIYPNPVITMLTIQLENSFVIDKINVIDLTGKVIITKTYDTTSVNVEKIATGMYIIEAYFGEKKFQTKFIKQ